MNQQSYVSVPDVKDTLFFDVTELLFNIDLRSFPPDF